MSQKAVIALSFFWAFLILAVSVFRTASVRYVFSQAPTPTPDVSVPLVPHIDYPLPDPAITPESPLWGVQALVSKTNSTPEGLLESADLRLAAGLAMYERGRVEESFVVLQKAAQYLKESKEAVTAENLLEDNLSLITQIAWSSLKHREVLETILITSPEDGRAVIAKTLEIPKLVYEETAPILLKFGREAPHNPF